MNRTEAREYMMTVAFQMDALEDFDIDKMDKFLAIETGNQEEYCKEVFSILCNKKEEIDEIIQTHCKKWDVRRMPKTDISILRIAVAEMVYHDTPKSVAINEAVELAKKYSDENSPSYINGILGSISRENDKE